MGMSSTELIDALGASVHVFVAVFLPIAILSGIAVIGIIGAMAWRDFFPKR